MTLPRAEASVRLAPDSLRIPGAVARELVAHARAELPNEACGLLSGRLADGSVTRFHPARNASASPWRYDLDASDLVRLVLQIETAGEDLVAIFHSHPVTDAVPSPTDVRELRYPALLLIAGFVAADSAELRAWRVEPGRAAEMPLQID